MIKVCFSFYDLPTNFIIKYTIIDICSLLGKKKCYSPLYDGQSRFMIPPYAPYILPLHDIRFTGKLRHIQVLRSVALEI